MERHVQTLGILMIVLGAMGMLALFAVIIVFAIGASFITEEDVALGALGLAAFVSAMIALTHIPAIIAGWGILNHKEWARILGLIVAILNLLAFPFGTAVAIYAFWVLVKQETVRVFATR